VNKSWRLAALALAAVFSLKLGVLLSLGEHPLLVPGGDLDGAYYVHFAGRVAAGDVWLQHPESFFGQPAVPFFLSPLYIYVLALVLKLGGGALATARFVQIVLGTLAVCLIALTARRWYGARAGWFAGAIAAGCGLFTFYEILILQASLEPFLTALELYLLTRALQAARDPDAARFAARWFAAAGLAFGLHALNRPNMFIVFAGLTVLLLVAGISRRFGRATHALVFLVAGLVAISPATIRNWRVSHEFVLIASHGGLNFYIGNGPDANGTFRSVMNIEPSVRGQWIEAPRAVQAEVGHPVTSGQVDSFFWRRAFDWIRAHPGAELRLLLTKTTYALSSTFLTLNHSYPFFARDVRGPLSYLVAGPTLILALGLVGLAFASRRDEAGFAIWAAYVPLAILSVVLFFVASRYRLPFQVALVIPAGGAIAWAIDRWRERDRSAVLRAGFVGALIAAGIAWPTHLNDGRAEEQARMGLFEIQSGRPESGEAWLTRALAGHAFPGVVHLRAGQLYETKGQPDLALAHYRDAQRIDPTEPVLPFVIGRTLFQQGKDAEAVVELEKARSGPQGDPATRLLVLSLSRLGRTAEVNTIIHQLDPARWTVDQSREFALALTSVGRVDLSIAAWQRAAAASGDGRDYERLGLAWIVAGRPVEALAAFDEGLKRLPNGASLHLNRAVTLSTLKRMDEARAEAEIALKIDPNYERTKQFMASIKGK
jgi:tetratricopeptide (TPR) repeat protein